MDLVLQQFFASHVLQLSTARLLRQGVAEALRLVTDGAQGGLDVSYPILALPHQGSLGFGHPITQFIHYRVHGSEGLPQVAAQALPRTAQLVLKLCGVGLGGVHDVFLLLLHMSAAFLDLPQGFLKHLIEPFLMGIAVLLRLLKDRRSAGHLFAEVEQQFLLIVLEHPVAPVNISGQP